MLSKFIIFNSAVLLTSWIGHAAAEAEDWSKKAKLTSNLDRPAVCDDQEGRSTLYQTDDLTFDWSALADKDKPAQWNLTINCKIADPDYDDGNTWSTITLYDGTLAFGDTKAKMLYNPHNDRKAHINDAEIALPETFVAFTYRIVDFDDTRKALMEKGTRDCEQPSLQPGRRRLRHRRGKKEDSIELDRPNFFSAMSDARSTGIPTASS